MHIFKPTSLLLFGVFFLFSIVTLSGQSIFTNSITGTNPNTSNPYTAGQTINANITVSGIGRGTGIAGTNANDRYNATGWNSGSFDANDYFTFTITPAAGYELDLSSFVYTGQASGTGPASFAFRSSADSYAANIGTANETGTTISLAAAAYQNLTSAITFRIYGWGASAAGGTYSINSFTFNGTVSAVTPPTRYWDISTAAGLGGTATWGTTFSTSSAGNTTLTTANSTNPIIYDGTAGTITLAASQAGSSHTFNVSSYTIATSGSGGKTLDGNIALVTSNLSVSPITGADLTLSGVISGSASASTLVLNKVGAGTLILNSNNTFTGRISVTAGFIQATGEARFGANPATFLANHITLNGGGIRNTAGSNVSFNSNRGITLGVSGGTFDVQTGNTITLINIVTGTGGLTKIGAGTLRLEVDGGSHTYTGATTVSAGTIQLEKDNDIDDASQLVLNGGAFNTARSSDGAGRNETVSTLRLNSSSTINLGTGNHSLNFANSNAISWTAGQTLTITGWEGTYGALTSGTAGKIFVGNSGSGLTAGQLGQIKFYDGSNNFGATILSTGEIVPIAVPTINVGSITAFANQCVNTFSAEKSYIVSGAYLTDDISITAPTGFEISLTSGSGFGSAPLVLSQSAGSVSNTTVYVRFAPNATGLNSASILHASAGANNQNVAVSGTGINTAPTVTTVTASTFTAATASSGGSGITGGCGVVDSKGIVWATATNPTILSNLGITNEGTGTTNFTSTLTGLAGNTTYYYRAYVTNSFGQTSYGSNLNFTFAPEIQLQQPVGTNVSCGASYDYGSVLTGTDNDITVRITNTGNAPLTITSLNITGSGFTIVGAPATPLVISAGSNQNITLRYAPATGGSHSGTFTITSNDANESSCTFLLSGSAIEPCSDLFISEYVEGSGNNKYIEIFNPTGSSINLSSYSLRLYTNGAGSSTNNVALSGSIAAYGTVVYRNTSASIFAGTSIVNAAVNFNGDDAVALAKSGVNIDIFGVIGNDPGSDWSLGGNQTEDQTLRRKFTVTNGISDNPSGTGAGAFITLFSEWDQFATDNISGLGSHSSSCLPTCTTPDRIEFITQPSNVQQNSLMASVQVRAYCSSDGTTASTYTGAVTLSVLQPGCGYTSQTVNAVNGVATFSSIIFLRSPQNNIRLSASAASLIGDTSLTFNITAPAGVPVSTTLRDDNFSAATIPWNYTVGTSTVNGSGGSGGTDVTAIKTFSSNDVLAKSYSVNNSASEQGSSNTITFDDVSGLAPYNYITFSFKVGSLGSGSGAGSDNGEDLMVDISTNNGSSWTSILTQLGGNNRLFNLSATPVTALSASSNTTYGSGSGLSAFTLQLSGISNFQFRVRASNNRNNENWVIDDVRLSGTNIPLASAYNLPTADAGNDIYICNGNTGQLSVNTTSFQAPLAYVWAPSASLNNPTISNPVATPSNNQIYTVNITDAHNCTSASQVQVLVHGIGGTQGLWTGSDDRNWFNCFNWSDGKVPDSTTNVMVAPTSNDPEVNQPGAMALDLDIANGALIEINDVSAIFSLHGSLINNGSLQHTQGLFELTGNGNVVINGNPTVFYDLKIDKPDSLILGTHTKATNRFIFQRGFVNTGLNTFELGSSNSQIGKLDYTNGHIIGRMKRWYDGISFGDSLGLFPLGNGTQDRFVKVEYTNAPSNGGSLMATYKNISMGTSGLPITVTTGSCAPFDITSSANEGYWQMDDGDGLAGGMYDITMVGEGFSTIADICQLSAIKRVGNGNWLQSGTHVDPTGTIARPIVKRTGASGWSNWGFSGGSVNPLPVEMISFFGICGDSESNITWSTASEINSQKFVIEKSSDLQLFEYVTEIAAAGNSNEVINYQASIPRSNGMLYYRLRQEDYDGTYEYFGPISVNCENNVEWNVFAFNNILHITITTSMLNNNWLDISDMNGKRIYAENLVPNAGLINQSIDMNFLCAGLYFVNIHSGGNVRAFKIIIVR